MKKLKVVFCGTPLIAATILQKLIDMKNVDVNLVISQPDKPVGRKKVILQTPVKEVALKNNIEIIQPNKIIDSFEKINLLKPDFIITCAYGQFIPTKILNIPKIVSLNLHGSLLPKYRGGAPIQYAIWNGDKFTGMSIMKMVKEMDAGDYYIQGKIEITDEDNAGTMFEKLGILGAKLLEDNLLKIANGSLKPIKQDETKVTFSKNITSEQEKINWNKSNREVFNQIRALYPWPIAHTFIENNRYKIGKTILSDFKTKEASGTIVNIDKQGITIATDAGCIKILEIQRPGKSMISTDKIWTSNFSDLKIGSRFK